MATKTKPKAVKASFSAEERAEIAIRQNLISTHQRTADLLSSELRLFTRYLLAEKGLDPDLLYTMDPETGELTERTADG